MALDTTTTTIHGGGTLYRAAAETAIPANLASLGAWTEVGYVSEEGWTLSHDPTEAEFFFYQDPSNPARSKITRNIKTAALELVQQDEVNFKTGFGGGTYDSAASVDQDYFYPPADPTETERSILITIEDGTRSWGLWLSRVVVNEIGDMVGGGGELTLLPVTFKVLLPSSGEPYGFVLPKAA